MQRKSVDSSNLASVGYDEGTQELQIEFKNGAVYTYGSVPSHIYASLMTAASHGKFFLANIRDKYEYTKEEVKS